MSTALAEPTLDIPAAEDAKKGRKIGSFTANELKRLGGAIESSRDNMKTWRQDRDKNIEILSGRCKTPTAVNLLAMAVDIYLRSVAPKAPRVMVSTDYRKLAADAARMELVGNHTLERIDYASTVHYTALDALFGVGVTRTGLAAGPEIDSSDGDRIPLGQPFADHVPFDDMLFDMDAKNFVRDSQFIGNYYEMDFDQFMEDPLFDAKAKKGAGPAEQATEPEKTSDIARDEDGPQPQRFREKILLLDVYVVKKKCIVTFDATRKTWTQPLRETPYEGPPAPLGPYKLLWFGDIPGNAKPLCPVETLVDLHGIVNTIFNKVTQQANREKTIVGFRQGADKDAEQVRDAADGSVVGMEDPNAISEYHFGGPNQVALAFLLTVKDLFSYIGGNLDAVGGLSPMSGTVGQDRMLEQAASKRMDAMQTRVFKHCHAVELDICYYIYSDPIATHRVMRPLPGYEDIEIADVWTPDHRKADFLRFNFEIDTYSTQFQSPGTQLQILTQVVREYIVPMIPLLQSQGISINMENLLRRVAKLANLKNPDDLLLFTSGQQQAEAEPTGGGGDFQQRPMKSPTSHRTYERRAESNGRSKSEAVIAQLLGLNRQTKNDSAGKRQVA